MTVAPISALSLVPFAAPLLILYAHTTHHAQYTMYVHAQCMYVREYRACSPHRAEQFNTAVLYCNNPEGIQLGRSEFRFFFTGRRSDITVLLFLFRTVVTVKLKYAVFHFTMWFCSVLFLMFSMRDVCVNATNWCLQPYLTLTWERLSSLGLFIMNILTF